MSLLPFPLLLNIHLFIYFFLVNNYAPLGFCSKSCQSCLQVSIKILRVLLLLMLAPKSICLFVGMTMSLDTAVVLST